MWGDDVRVCKKLGVGGGDPKGPFLSFEWGRRQYVFIVYSIVPDQTELLGLSHRYTWMDEARKVTDLQCVQSEICKDSVFSFSFAYMFEMYSFWKSLACLKKHIMKSGLKNFFFPQWVASIDLAENNEASANIVVKMSNSFVEQADQVTKLPFILNFSFCTFIWSNQMKSMAKFVSTSKFSDLNKHYSLFFPCWDDRLFEFLHFIQLWNTMNLCYLLPWHPWISASTDSRWPHTKALQA